MIREGEVMATVSDVARSAQVSVGMVSRLLNEDPTLRIRAETRDRILQAASELNYTPNSAARALRMSSSGTIGLAVHDASNPIYSAIIAGAQAEATAAGYALMLADVDALAQGGKVFRRVMSSGAIDGLLLQRAGTISDSVVSKLAAQQIPIVLLNDRTEGEISSVGVDDYAGAHLATEHLISLGHRRIGFLQVDGPEARSERRQQGWVDALANAGIERDPRLVIVGGHTADDGYAGMRKMLELAERPTAVFAANVLAGVGALTACRDSGVVVPDQISIVGLHDIPLAEHLAPRLTVARLPLFEMGARAIGILVEQLADGKLRHETIVSPGPLMIVRESTSRVRAAYSC